MGQACQHSLWQSKLIPMLHMLECLYWKQKNEGTGIQVSCAPCGIWPNSLRSSGILTLLVQLRSPNLFKEVKCTMPRVNIDTFKCKHHAKWPWTRTSGSKMMHSQACDVFQSPPSLNYHSGTNSHRELSGISHPAINRWLSPTCVFPTHSSRVELFAQRSCSGDLSWSL